jgi:response regulator RpfG family c-di-GMP phosphodiesterase
MLNRVLFVDDEPNVLDAIERQLHKYFEIETAQGPEAGLQAIAENGPFAAVVSDLRMPGMDGIEFLGQVKQMAPDTVRVMLSGQADLDAALAALNQRGVFQFLTKPCPSELLQRTLEAALEHYRLITSERELLEQTLRGSIAVLSDILSLANPMAFSRAQRIRHYVKQMAVELELPDQWELELAAMLSQIGCVSVPQEILEKLRLGARLTEQEAEMLESQSTVGHDLLAQIPRLEAVARMVAGQHAPWSARGGSHDKIKVGAHLLKIALDFDDAIVRGDELHEVLSRMEYHPDYKESFVVALRRVHVDQKDAQIRGVTVTQMRTGMIIHADVKSKNGLLLLAEGQEVTASAIFRLHNFAQTIGVIEPISVIVPPVKDGETEQKSIPLPEPIHP